MSTLANIYLTYAPADEPLARQLLAYLESKQITGINIFDPTIDYQPAASQRLLLMAIVSRNHAADPELIANIDRAKQQGFTVVPLTTDECEMPATLRKVQPFDFTQILAGQWQFFIEKVTGPLLREVVSAAPMSAPAPAASGGSVFKSIIDKFNPFKKKAPTGFPAEDVEAAPPPRFDKMSTTNRTASSRPAAPKSALQPREPLEEALPPEKYEPYIAAQPSPAEALPKMAGETTAEPSGAGKLLYDIPDSMTVNKEQTCIVRVGKNEAIVLDDNSFSPAVQMDDIIIAQVMEADLFDLSEPPHFKIRKLSSTDQEVLNDAYTEWVFKVTPLTSGTFPLTLKVSTVRVIDGKERRRELVFEKSVNIRASETPQASPTVTPLVNHANPPAQPMKDLAKEPVKNLEPPSVFISYAHTDKVYFDIFSQYLRQHSGWNIWTDRNIKIGEGWFNAIQQSIKDSDMAVLLVSAGFISSAFIKENEFARFKELKNIKPTFVFLPILLRDVDFTRWEELAELQLFVAYGDEYGVVGKQGQLIPFASLCRFDNNGQLIPNDQVDTYFKNLVKKAEKDWLKQVL